VSLTLPIFSSSDIRTLPRVQAFLDLAATSQHRELDAGEVLLHEGANTGAFYVLLDGRLRVEKGGAPGAAISEPGACVGEMALLLDVPATANVVAHEHSVVAVIEDAAQILRDRPDLSLAIARTLAARVQHMTTYLADLQHQYRDHEGGLGMVDKVLGTLMHRSGTRSTLASERDPDPEY
jgi:CRP-like cAMP-binding protein